MDKLHWRIELFGGLRAIYSNEIISQFRSRKTAALLAYLAFFRGPHPRDKLVEMLWPDSSLEAGRNSLRVALADLRRRSSLSDESGAAPPLLQQDHGTIGLCREVTTDVADFEMAVNEARRAVSLEDRVVAYERAQALYGGTFLSGLYESWIPVEEARLETTFLYVLKALEGIYENSGDSLRAIEMRQLSARFETNEADGSPLRGRNRWTSVSKKRKDGASKDVTSEKGSSSFTKPIAPLPATLTRFFGRDTELGELAALILDGDTRLLTITGGGGMGKTRLALELARRLERPLSPTVEARSMRAFWVGLADTLDAQRLPEDIINVLNLTVSAEETGARKSGLLDAISQFLADQSRSDSRVLLVLDNFEQLLPEGATFLGALLERVPSLCLLVTSRQRLNLTGEWEYRIGALALPSQNQLSSREEAKLTYWDEQQLANLRDSSSVQLFADRARGARTDWRLFPHEASTLIALLHRLEGVPLAIELVASRAGVLSIEEMLTRLSHNLQWVSSRDSHRPARHRSLHNVLEWSLGLLPPRDREIFARLSVFHGGWTLESACAVLSDVDSDDLLESLQTLRDASLITSGESEGGQLRFSMLELVRQIASTRLDKEQHLAMRRKHAEFYARLAEHSTILEQIHEQRDVWEATEGRNFSAALDFWASTDIERALEMASALWWYWIFSYHLPEGCHYFRELLSNPRAEDFPVVRARAQRCAAYIALLSGHYDEVEELLDKALIVWQGANYRSERAAAWNLLGSLAVARGEKQKARDFYAQSLELRRALGTQHDLIIALNALAGAERNCGNAETARLLCDEALQLASQSGNTAAQSWTYNTLGLLDFDEGNFSSARAYQEQSLSIRRTNKHLQGQASCLDALGDVALCEGNLESARALYLEALEIWQQIKQMPKARSTQEKLDSMQKT